VRDAVDPDFLLRALYVLGAVFLLINLQQFYLYWKFARIRSTALLTWAAPRPPLFRLFTWVGAVLAILVFYKLAVLRLHPKYVYALPLGVKINRGFYEDGIWTEGGFVPYVNIGGLTWREGTEPTLVLLYRWRTFARRLIVPEPYFGQARRLLRDKIAAHDIHFTGKTLDLGAHDERDDV
jgi:hypothetical protein